MRKPLITVRQIDNITHIIIRNSRYRRTIFPVKKELQVKPVILSTTILAVRKDGRVAIGGDGQVTMNAAVVKQDAKKIRRLYHDKVLVGFAGSSADAFALMERFDAKLEQYQGNVLRSAHELAKEWRTDKVLRRLESLLIVVDKHHSFLISGGAML